MVTANVVFGNVVHGFPTIWYDDAGSSGITWAKNVEFTNGASAWGGSQSSGNIEYCSNFDSFRNNNTAGGSGLDGAAFCSPPALIHFVASSNTAMKLYPDN
jgi:hypothetical protein